MTTAFAWSESPVAMIAAGLAALGLVLLVAGLVSLVRLRAVAFAFRTLLGLAATSAGLSIGLVAVGTFGYAALTAEEPVARIEVRPAGAQRFDATFIHRDGRAVQFALAGDEVYVDARILKWQPLGALAGLKTMYELDRIAGRYRSIEDEQKNARTVYALGASKPIDLFQLRQRFGRLARLVDAQYGSAAWVPADKPVDLDLSVTTSGLVLRPAVARQPSRT